MVTSEDLKINIIQQIAVKDWDAFVQKVYGKPYSYQQQDGCKERGIVHFEVPCADAEDYENEEESLRALGVKFDIWLEANPSEKTKLFWDRNFYPSFGMVCNDLHEKGLLKAGRYQINIDW